MLRFLSWVGADLLIPLLCNYDFLVFGTFSPISCFSVILLHEYVIHVPCAGTNVDIWAAQSETVPSNMRNMYRFRSCACEKYHPGLRSQLYIQ